MPLGILVFEIHSFGIKRWYVLQCLQREEIDTSNKSNFPQHLCYLKKYWSFEYWLLISLGSGMTTLAFFVLCITARITQGRDKGK